MNYGLKSRLHKSQIYKTKKISSGLAVALLKFSVVIILTGHMPFFKVENGYLKGFNEAELYTPLEVKANFMAR